MLTKPSTGTIILTEVSSDMHTYEDLAKGEEAEAAFCGRYGEVLYLGRAGTVLILVVSSCDTWKKKQFPFPPTDASCLLL